MKNDVCQIDCRRSASAAGPRFQTKRFSGWWNFTSPQLQAQAIQLLADFEGVIFNPRLAEWPDDNEEIQRQTVWERNYLGLADLRAFWFPPETDCPITLLEHGFSLGAKLPIVVGCDPAYSRKLDVEIQTRLSRPEIQIADSVAELATNVYNYFNSTSGANR